MSQTPPPGVDDLPTSPGTNGPTNFNTVADAFVAALYVFRTQLVALALNVYNNALDCYANAVLALGYKNSAQTSASNASTSAANAALSEAAAYVSANAVLWVSGNTYAQYAGVISPLDGGTYRRRTASGSGTTDPKNDPTNWRNISGNGAMPRTVRTSNTMLSANDLGAFIDVTSGTFTQTIDAAATLLPGWYCIYRNSGSGVITIDPNGAETIDGFASVTISNEEFGIIQGDGTALRWIPLSSGIKHYSSGWDRNSYNVMTTASPIAMPDMTTVSSRFGVQVDSNSPTVPTAITTSDGWSVTTGFAANTFKSIAPQVRATPHGWWGGSAMTPPSPGALAFGTTPTTTYPMSSVALSSTLHVMSYYDASNVYMVAYNPVTGASGAVQSMALSSVYSAHANPMYAVSSTSFVLFATDGGSVGKAVAGSISGLAITLSTTPLTLGSAMGDPSPVQLTSTSFLVALRATNDLVVVTVTGTVVAAGTAVASGNPSPINGTTKIAFVTSTTALVSYPNAASTTCEHTLRVASISGGSTITMNTAATTSSASTLVASNSSGSCSIFPMAPGGPFIYLARDFTTSTNGHFFGVTVSGTTVNIGANNTKVGMTCQGYRASTFVYPQGWGSAASPNLAFMPVDATKSLFAFPSGAGTGAYCISISGTALTFTGPYAGVTAPYGFITDIATGLNTYVIGSSQLAKITLSGTTINTSYVLGVAATVMFSDTVSDKSWTYGGVAYSPTGTPAIHTPISATKYLNVSGSTFNIYSEWY